MTSIKAAAPTRPPTHKEVELGRLSSMGLELEEIADDDTIELAKLVELAEDRGRPPSHYLAAIPLATSLSLRSAAAAPITIRVCVGACQRYGALDVLEALVNQPRQRCAIAPVTCLDRCDHAAACELEGAHGKLVIAPATPAAVIEALDTLTS